MILDEVLARLGAMPEADRQALKAEALRLTADARWVPNPGPQTDAVMSRADVLLYGGAAAGGKTDCLLGLAMTAHRRSLIVRRHYTNLGAIIDRAVEMNGTKDGMNRSPPPRLTTADGRIIDFGAVGRPGDEQAWQGQPHDLLGVDEATQCLESQIRFLMGWVRTTIEGQRCRTVLATNPPLSAEGDWVVGMFRPWLDLTHPTPAQPGELRWFVADPDGRDMEVSGPEPVEVAGRLVSPQARTFIPARLADNPELAKSDYGARLDALPEPLRSAVRDGNFMAARQDDQWQVIPSTWIFEAQARWGKEPPQHAPMSCIGVDVAQGGADQTVLSARYDGWFAPIEAVPGAQTPTGAEVAGLVVSRRLHNCDVVIDMGGGWGGDAFSRLKETIGPEKVHAHKGASSSTRRTADQTLGFYNKRAEVWWKFREALDPGQDQGSPVALPDDPELVADLTAPRFEVTSRGIKIETKEDVVKRLGRSPDKGDAVVMAWAGGPRLQTHGNQWREAMRQTTSRQVRVVMGREAARRRRH